MHRVEEKRIPAVVASYDCERNDRSTHDESPDGKKTQLGQVRVDIPTLVAAHSAGLPVPPVFVEKGDRLFNVELGFRIDYHAKESYRSQ
jgi:hypothetical protein